MVLLPPYLSVWGFIPFTRYLVSGYWKSNSSWRSTNDLNNALSALWPGTEINHREGIISHLQLSTMADDCHSVSWVVLAGKNAEPEAGDSQYSPWKSSQCLSHMVVRNKQDSMWGLLRNESAERKISVARSF